MGSLSEDACILDYGPNTSAAANAVFSGNAVRLAGKLGVGVQIIPSASASGSVAVQMTNYDDHRQTTGSPGALSSWVTTQTISVVAGVNSMTLVANPFAKYIRLVFTAGSGSSGTVQFSLNLRAAYAT